MNKQLTISVIVTNWNGNKLIKKSLPIIINNSPEAIEIIIADDASSDKSLQTIKVLQKTYPQLKLISHVHNQGFTRNSNFAIKKAKGDLVVLLNSDIYPHPNYLKHITKHFQDPKVFGVGFSEYGRENWARIFWKEGYLQHEPGIDTTKLHISAWISGGSSIVRKSEFIRLGGFDNIYAPFYSEDLDLGYRAWKSGYTLLWDPQAIVDHKHEATISKFPRRFVEYVKERNRLLTVWRNITDKELLNKNRLAIILRVIFGPNYIKIIRAAKRQCNQNPPPIVFPVRTDRQILDLFSNHEK